VRAHPTAVAPNPMTAFRTVSAGPDTSGGQEIQPRNGLGVDPRQAQVSLWGSHIRCKDMT